ncbi:MAG: hypothetical protein LBR23_01220, partial [Spirochaetaceae bacterium]|nr:hypothetical protein [Spirochaetaceae bacterium]
VKEKLLALEEPELEFSVIFSGKKSKKVNGLYKSNTREIIIHNRNFEAGSPEGDNLLLYTAIHEYAHHLHACSRGGTLPARAHNAEFRAILHGLLEKAESLGLYRNVFAGSGELSKLTGIIREKYLKENGELLKDLGAQLLKARELCEAAGGRFEDYLDRSLCIPRSAANLAIRMHQYNLDPRTGPDNMRFLAGIRNEDDRQAAEAALIKGSSPDKVKIALRSQKSAQDPVKELEREKQRLERTIASLTNRLEEVEEKLKGGA